MRIVDHWIAKLIAAVLILLGVAVSAGWVLQVRALTQGLPSLTAMVIDTAIGFCLAGSAILARLSANPSIQAWSDRASWSLLALTVVNAIQLGTGADLGISLPSLHSWIRDDNSNSGRMSEPMIMAFALAASSLLMLRFRAKAYATEIGRTLGVR